MKNGIIGVIMVLCLALVLVAGCGGPKDSNTLPPAELLTNGGFESALGAEWVKSDSALTAGTRVDSGVTAPHGGSYCLQVTNRQNNWDSLQQSILSVLETEGPGTYHIQFYAKLPSGSDTFWVQTAYGDGTNQWWTNGTDTGETVTVGTDWILVSANLNLAWGANPLTYANVTFKSNTTTDVYVDDFSMKEAE